MRSIQIDVCRDVLESIDTLDFPVPLWREGKEDRLMQDTTDACLRPQIIGACFFIKVSELVEWMDNTCGIG